MGLLWMLIKARVPDGVAQESRTAWVMIWLAVVLTFLVVTKNALAVPQYQGRYFFPSIGALSLLSASGWFALLSASARRYLPHLTVCLMLSLNFFLWFEKILPAFYQPFDG